MSKIFFYFILVLVFFSTDAHAYLDPGIGGIILQAIFGLIAAIVTFYYLLKEKVKNFFLKIRNIIRGKNTRSKD